MFTGRLFGGMPAISCPSMRIWPSLGSSKPAIMRSSVVLPQPEGPSSTKNSPALMSRLTSSTAVTRPKRFETLRIWMIGWRGLSVINDPKSVRVEPSRDTVMECTHDRHLDLAPRDREEGLYQKRKNRM